MVKIFLVGFETCNSTIKLRLKVIIIFSKLLKTLWFSVDILIDSSKFNCIVYYHTISGLMLDIVRDLSHIMMWTSQHTQEHTALTRHNVLTFHNIA